MTSFDFDVACRWARFDPRRTLQRRKVEDLPFVSDARIAGMPLLFDTCVYIDQLRSSVSEAVVRLIAARQLNHSTIAIQELMHAVGALDPEHSRTRSATESIRRQVQSMRRHRIHAPDPDVLGRAALLAGMLSRLQGYAKDARFKALQDCTLFLQTQKLGFTLLTANIAEFDLLLQLIPSGRVLFYRTV